MGADEFDKRQTQPGVPKPKKKHPLLKGGKIPEKIGPYRIEGLLEKGGMSLLYLGIHPDTKDPIIIKVLSPEFTSDAEMVRRFLNEGEIIAMADHPNIVRLYGHGRWEGGLYIAMEFVQGISLKHFMTHQTMSLKRALEIVVDVGYALCHLHTHGVIHRDLKPENILLTESGSIKVIDFGIAQLLNDGEDERITKRRRLIGTPIYMSPEQKENPRAVSFPSDIYSLAIITYELVLGRLSHGVIQLSLMPRGLQSILAKALQPNPQDRYQDVVDFIADISNYLNSAALQNEKKGGDRVNELAETLQVAQNALLPSQAPLWPKVEIGIVSQKGMKVSGMYYDFFDLPDGAYGILMAECPTEGGEGLVYTAVLRGMVRTLARLAEEPVELVNALNGLLIKDPIDQLFTLSYLILKPNQDRLHYISCGYGNLWHMPSGLDTPKKIKADNIAIGIDPDADYLEVNYPWHVGDMIALTSFGTSREESSKEAPLSDSEFKAILMQNLYKPPQRLADTIMRKVATVKKNPVQGRPVAIISILRTD